jgi:hypothetical protein
LDAVVQAWRLAIRLKLSEVCCLECLASRLRAHEEGMRCLDTGRDH